MTQDYLLEWLAPSAQVGVEEVADSSWIQGDDCTSALPEWSNPYPQQEVTLRAAPRERVVYSHEGLYKVMLRNIPARCRVDELKQAIEDLGYQGLYISFNMPVKGSKILNRGYAFVTFDELDTATAFAHAINGYSFPGRLGSKVVLAEAPELQDVLCGSGKRAKHRAAECKENLLCLPPGVKVLSFRTL
eukprot:TRINITY_DN3627_c0_g2_i1.p1 TRINITY_DN3627_c0_g2~~TRINITY_DN3627_c0_g2_i1.p1  ORF type:complete len:189 (-),score=30.50 TRINITY_DN3627_c0_g2_i1:116-682(-)